MPQITLGDLKRVNPSHKWHLVNEVELARVNELIARIEDIRVRTSPKPLDGDRVICFSTTIGQVSDRACLDCRTDIHDKPYVEVCVNPSGVYLFPENLHVDIGGGPWYEYHDNFLSQGEYVGKTLQTFWTWNSWGIGQNNAIYFQAEVSLWKLTADHKFN